MDSDGEAIKKEEKGKKEAVKEGEEEEEKGFRLGPSDFLSSLKEGEKEFTGIDISNVTFLNTRYCMYLLTSTKMSDVRSGYGKYCA